MSFVWIKHQDVFKLAWGGGSLPGITVKVTLFHTEATPVLLSSGLPNSDFANRQLYSRIESPNRAQIWDAFCSSSPEQRGTLYHWEVGAVDVLVDLKVKTINEMGKSAKAEKKKKRCSLNPSLC